MKMYSKNSIEYHMGGLIKNLKNMMSINFFLYDGGLE